MSPAKSEAVVLLTLAFLIAVCAFWTLLAVGIVACVVVGL